VGAIIQNPSTESFVFDAFNLKLQNLGYLLPIGCLPPVRFQVLFNNRDELAFGNRQDWLCPFYDTGKNQCGIWRYRGSTCSTYYCTSDYGKSGLKFWSNLSDMLNLVEIRLAELALKKMGFSEDQILGQFEYFNCTDGTDEELSSDSLSSALWGHYWGNRNINVFDFYRQTYEIVANLTIEDLDPDFKDAEYCKIESKLLRAFSRL
jgi:Fe-S-cluster containining protein